MLKRLKKYRENDKPFSLYKKKRIRED